MADDLADAIATLRAATWPSDATAVDHFALTLLQDAGFTGRLRVARSYLNARGKSVNGWINLVVERGAEPIAIEIDADRARDKSVQKLRMFKGRRLIVLRHGKSFRPIQCRGIDRIISVAVEWVGK